jgi:hypothetical protein
LQRKQRAVTENETANCKNRLSDIFPVVALLQATQALLKQKAEKRGKIFCR